MLVTEGRILVPRGRAPSRSNDIPFLNDFEHAQSDGKAVNRELRVLHLASGLARVRDSWC